MCFGSSARPPSPVGRPPRLVSSITSPARVIHEHRVPWSGAGQYVFTVAFRPSKPDFNDQPTLASVTIQAFNFNDDPVEQTRRGKLLYDAINVLAGSSLMFGRYLGAHSRGHTVDISTTRYHGPSYSRRAIRRLRTSSSSTR